jgi:hypothetical protein
MLKTLPRMKLSRDEDVFFRHWIHDEFHYREGQGPAKRLQLEHHVTSADMATLIAASISAVEQHAAAMGQPPVEQPRWPWTEESLRTRLAEARGADACLGMKCSPPRPV